MARFEIPIHVDGLEIVEQLKKEGKLVAVVRCKECKYNYANTIPSHSAECSLYVELPITDEFFCAKGEREGE